MIDQVKDIKVKLKEFLETYMNEGFKTEDNKTVSFLNDFLGLQEKDRLASFNLLTEYLEPKIQRSSIIDFDAEEDETVIEYTVIRNEKFRNNGSV